MKTRREFLKTMGVVGAGALMIRVLPSWMKPKKNIGLQLWTLRDTIEKETLPTLHKVSQAGYTHIEPYGFDGSFYGIPATEFKKMVRDLGMRITCTHTGITAKNADVLLEAAVKTGMEYIVLPSAMGRPLEVADDYKRLAAEMNIIGDKAHRAGIRFGYHNHDHEISSDGNGVFYDILLNETDPDLVCFQLDIYWIIKGGYDPVAYFTKYPGRFALWHVKDMAETGESTIIGSGTINYIELFRFRELAGMHYFYVEQESYSVSPIESAEQSCAYIRDHLI
jgi:sugar phosphate isomerase/epimerase